MIDVVRSAHTRAHSSAANSTHISKLAASIVSDVKYFDRCRNLETELPLRRTYVLGHEQIVEFVERNKYYVDGLFQQAMIVLKRKITMISRGYAPDESYTIQPTAAPSYNHTIILL
jgi:hypothetical protein